MTVERFAISFDAALARAVRKSAAREPTSAWLADAARRKLRAEGLRSVVTEWETRHGELSPAELERAERRAAGGPAPRRARRRKL